MGYTHYWEYNREFTEGEWQRIGKAFKKLDEATPDVPLAGVTGEGSPEISGGYLGFNGLAPHCVEPFELYRTRAVWAAHRGTASNRPWRGFCKTNHQPYDFAVMTLLLLVDDIAPEALTISSDEDMDGPPWMPAREMFNRLKGKF